MRSQAGGAAASGEQRHRAALALCALASGGSRGRLAVQLGMPRAAGAALVAGLLAALPGVAAWWAAEWGAAAARGWVASAGGRRWPLPGVARMAPRARALPCPSWPPLPRTPSTPALPLWQLDEVSRQIPLHSKATLR